jgi:hypothetical protein
MVIETGPQTAACNAQMSGVKVSIKGTVALAPQAGRVTVSHGGGRVRAGGEGGTMPPCYMDLERLSFYIDYEAFKQWH